MGPQPHPFRYSLDWRFLIPLTDTQKIYLLLEEDQGFSQALEQVGIHPSQQLSFVELKQIATNEMQSLVLPFGVPAHWVPTKPEDQVGFYAALRRLISTDGYLLVGFNNVWSGRPRSQKKYHPATPQRIVNQLEGAGFRSIKVFGAMPNLAISEYIFDLDSRTMQFAFQNRFRRKPAVLHALRVLSAAMGWRRLSNFLPCYFAVASV